MRKFIFVYFILLLIPVFGQEKLDGKTAGVIYSREEADKLYGKVLNSKAISNEELNGYLSKTDSYIMLYFNKDQKAAPVILDQSQKALNTSYESKASRPAELKVYSVSKVKELIEKGGENTTMIEQREDVISLTNGEYTLEMSLGCPPWCPEE